MAPLNVTIKHSGKTYSLQLDTSEPPITFKNAIYQATGVPVDRMKVMTKAGVLKVQRLKLRRSYPSMLTSYERMILTGRKWPQKRYDRSCAILTSLTRSSNQGGSFMVVGSAGELPKPPETPTVFLEGIGLAERSVYYANSALKI